jgi:hypothetical protein
MALQQYQGQDMSVIKQMAEYLFIKKKDPNSPDSQWLRYMHGINRLSIFLFIFGILFVLIFKFFRKG